MTLSWQNLAVILSLLAALAYLGRQFFRRKSRTCSPACNCPKVEERRKIVSRKTQDPHS